MKSFIAALYNAYTFVHCGDGELRVCEKRSVRAMRNVPRHAEGWRTPMLRRFGKNGMAGSRFISISVDHRETDSQTTRSHFWSAALSAATESAMPSRLQSFTVSSPVCILPRDKH